MPEDVRNSRKVYLPWGCQVNPSTIIAAPARPAHGGCPVVAVDSGIPPFPSVRSAAKSFGVYPTAIRYAVESGTRSCGYWWRYFDMPISCQPLQPAKNKRIRMSGCEFPSIQAAADLTGLSRRQIETRIQNGTAQLPTPAKIGATA